MRSEERLEKYAAAVIQMGDPISAGKALADIVKFLVSRISFENRHKALQNLKGKITALNEREIASKKMPASASLGQSIVFIKTVLNGHNSQYVREILNEIARHL